MITEITEAKYESLVFKLYCMADTERHNRLTARLRKSVSEHDIKEFNSVKQDITKELNTEKPAFQKKCLTTFPPKSTMLKMNSNIIIYKHD